MANRIRPKKIASMIMHRDQYLAKQGFKVLRIAGYQVFRDPPAVLRQIEAAVDEQMK